MTKLFCDCCGDEIKRDPASSDAPNVFIYGGFRLFVSYTRLIDDKLSDTDLCRDCIAGVILKRHVVRAAPANAEDRRAR